MTSGAIFLTLILVGVFIVVVRAHQYRSDAERRSTARATWQAENAQRQAERRDAALLRELKRCFPFLYTAVRAGIKTGVSPQKAIDDAVRSLDAVHLGTTEAGMPVVLPAFLRSRHVCLGGKSGYGKSSAMVHMILEDLRKDRGVIVICPEHELFEDFLLPLVPDRRVDEVIYFAPARSARITFNPFVLEQGDEAGQRAAELLSVLKRAVGEEGSLGQRSEPLLANAIGLGLGRDDACLVSLRRVLTDEEYRAHVVTEARDPYVRQYWTSTYPKLPRGSEVPTLNRLDGFLRTRAIRDALAGPDSSFSFRQVIEKRMVLFCDLSGLSPETMRLAGGFLIAALQCEFLRREKVPGSQRHPVHVYVDEFPTVAGVAEGSWLTLLSRGRKYGAALTLALQNPGTLSPSLREMLFANTSNLITFNLSARDAAAVRREFLVCGPDGVIGPVSVARLVALGVGEGIGRIGTGSGAVHVRFRQPIPEQDRFRAEEVRLRSWARYGVAPSPELVALPKAPSAEFRGTDPEKLTSICTSGPGRGGQLHTFLQGLAKQFGEEHGFRADIELEILGGAGRVDVALARGDTRIAVEVAVTSTPQQAACTVTKCLAAGFTHVVLVSGDRAVLERAEKHATPSVPAKDRNKVRFLSPDELRSFLSGLSDTPDAEGRTAGYRIKVSAEPVSPAGQGPRRRTLARLVGTALLRRRVSS